MTEAGILGLFRVTIVLRLRVKQLRIAYVYPL